MTCRWAQPYTPGCVIAARRYLDRAAHAADLVVRLLLLDETEDRQRARWLFLLSGAFAPERDAVCGAWLTIRARLGFAGHSSGPAI